MISRTQRPGSDLQLPARASRRPRSTAEPLKTVRGVVRSGRQAGARELRSEPSWDRAGRWIRSPPRVRRQALGAGNRLRYPRRAHRGWSKGGRGAASDPRWVATPPRHSGPGNCERAPRKKKWRLWNKSVAHDEVVAGGDAQPSASRASRIVQSAHGRKKREEEEVQLGRATGGQARPGVRPDHRGGASQPALRAAAGRCQLPRSP